MTPGTLPTKRHDWAWFRAGRWATGRDIVPLLRGALILLVVSLTTSGTSLAQSTSACAAGPSAQSASGVSRLRDRLGDVIGSPVECEHPGAANGETAQQTTTGIVSYAADRDTSTFTDGRVHYALTGGRLVRWQGDGPDLPALSTDEATYLDSTAPHREHLANLFASLQEYQRIAEAGQLGQMDGNVLRALDYQFTAAQQAFNATSPSGRFDRYVQTVRQATQHGHDAAGFLLQAQHAAPDEDHDGPIAQARPHVNSGVRFRQDADDLLSFIVPIDVTP